MTFIALRGAVAQWLQRWTTVRTIEGSNPGGGEVFQTEMCANVQNVSKLLTCSLKSTETIMSVPDIRLVKKDSVQLCPTRVIDFGANLSCQKLSRV